MLYKFSFPAAYSLENLQKRVLYCRHYSTLNDPFEFWTKVNSGIPDKEIEYGRFLAAAKHWGFTEDNLSFCLENSEEYFDSVADYQPDFPILFDHSRITCFGTDPSNLLLWSHYADGLRGFCAVYDSSILVSQEDDCIIESVKYFTRPPVIDSFQYAVAYDQYEYHMMAAEEARSKNEKGVAGSYQRVANKALKFMQFTWKKAFATKPVEWAYEQEERLLVHSRNNNQNPLFFQYPVEALREIIIGERMPDEYKSELLEIVGDYYGELPVKTARRSKSAFKIIID